MKFTRVISRVKILKFYDVSKTELAHETSEHFNILTQLIAQENFIELLMNIYEKTNTNNIKTEQLTEVEF
jgi:hypothetical protein